MRRITPVRRIARKKRLSITARGGGRGRRDRIESAGAERMAASDATQGEPAAAPGAMPLQRLDRVLRTRRMIATRGGEERGEEELVRPDDRHEEDAHRSGSSGSGGRWGGAQPPHRLREIRGEGRDGHAVRGRIGSHDDIARRVRDEHRPEGLPNEFAEPALHEIPGDGGVFVARDDDPDPGETSKGSEGPELQCGGPDSLPCQSHRLEIGGARQPSCWRNPPRRLRRQRTWTGASR